MTEVVEEVTPGLTEYEDGAEEWEVAFYAYRAAQAKTATTAGYLVLNEWNTLVNPASITRSSAGQFMDYLVRIIRAFRLRQMNLARSYLQYVAALEIQAPGGEPLFGGDSTRLSGYRDVFIDGMRDAAGMGTGEVPLWPTDADWDFVLSELRQLDAEGASSNSKSAPLSDLDLDRHLEDLERSLEGDRGLEGVEFNWPEPEGERNDQGHREYFENLIVELEDELREAQRKDDLLASDDESPEDRRDREAERAEELKRVQGNKLAGQVMQATSHAADQVTQWARNSDRRIRMVARGTSATPCAFCAMLASRGFEYSSVSSAMTTSGGNGGFQRYHPNCQCYPIVRYVDASEAPALSKKFREMWEDSKGHGEPTMNVFRRALYEINRDAINARRRRLHHERKAERAIDAAGNA